MSDTVLEKALGSVGFNEDQAHILASAIGQREVNEDIAAIKGDVEAIKNGLNAFKLETEKRFGALEGEFKVHRWAFTILTALLLLNTGLVIGLFKK